MFGLFNNQFGQMPPNGQMQGQQPMWQGQHNQAFPPQPMGQQPPMPGMGQGMGQGMPPMGQGMPQMGQGWLSGMFQPQMGQMQGGMHNDHMKGIKPHDMPGFQHGMGRQNRMMGTI